MRDGTLAALTEACAKCGACRAACTLYPERKAEGAVARGKVALVESALRGEDRDLPALREALADCLLCGRCERDCPNRVGVEEIVMRGRARIAEEIGIPAWQRIVLGRVLPSPKARGAGRRAGSLVQRFLARIPTESGLHYRVPGTFGAGGRTVPALPRRGFSGSLPAGQGIRGEVVLFPGCVFDHLFPEVGRAAYETMRLSGRTVSVFRDAPCCGLPAMASGDFAAARRGARENLRRLLDSAATQVVFPCGSCLVMFRRNLPILFPEGDPAHGDAVRLADRCRDYASFLLESGVARTISPRHGEAAGEVGYHDPCHLSGTLGKGREAREVLRRAVGESFAEMEGADLCCGYGGTFNLRDYGTSSRIGEGKVARARRGGTRVIATACSGCLLQLRDQSARTSPDVRVVHLAELVLPAASPR